jgi:ParB-like chromosome segregation protein Spo0J
LHFTQEELAKRMGKSQSTIANKMRLLSLTNEVQVALMNNLISERHARCLLQIKDEDLQKQVLNKIISERINVRDTDEYIKNLLGITKETPPISNSNEHNIDLTIPIDKTQNPLYEANEPPTHEEQKNPNVYTQTKNIDFININSLDTPEENLKVETPQKENDNMILTNNEIPKIEENNNVNNISKIKYATAIKLAQDAVADIKKAGYNVSLEEIDTTNDYQIIIKLQK